MRFCKKGEKKQKTNKYTKNQKTNNFNFRAQKEVE